VALSSVVLDTLLCILVDSSPALRVFEESNGVQVVVKLLKRAGTPREVRLVSIWICATSPSSSCIYRMKCLEFLYFYLIDETLPWMQQVQPSPSAPTATSSPLSRHPSYPPTGSSPDRPTSRAPPRNPNQLYCDGNTPLATPVASPIQVSPSSNGATSSLTSTSGQSTLSFRSNAPSYAESALPPYTAAVQAPAQLCGISMLHKEVNFVPVSPRKPASLGSARETSSMWRHRKAMDSMSLSDTDSFSVQDCDSSAEENTPCPQSWPFGAPGQKIHSPLRTTDQKKELLGKLLGNVDALVEGVRKAGIWGLG
jgi:hypothetical protein